MIEFLYIPIIILLYFRTWKYYWLIDDHVKRDGYMYTIIDYKMDPKFYQTQRPILATVTNIGVFIATCVYIHYFWGWKVALLYAVFPLNVCGVAWVTGNYYMTTVLLLLSTHLLFTKIPFIWLKLVLGQAMYIAMLNSTISGLPYAVIALFYSYGWTFIFPTLMFIYGRRVTSGLRQRKKVHEDLKTFSGTTLNHLWNIPKVLAYDVFLSFWPSRLGLFHWFGKQPWFKSRDFTIASFLIVILFSIWGFYLDWRMTIAWFLFAGLYSQWTTFGQFFAERYLVIPNIFFCVLLVKYFEIIPHGDILLSVLASLWFYRSHIYIKAHENNGTWMTDGARNFPRSPESYTNLGNLYMDEGRYIDAVRPLLQALEFTTGMKFNAIANLSHCYRACGMYEKARYYTILAIGDPNCPEKQKDNLKNNLKEIELKMKRIDRDRKELKKRGII